MWVRCCLDFKHLYSMYDARCLSERMPLAGWLKMWGHLGQSDNQIRLKMLVIAAQILNHARLYSGGCQKLTPWNQGSNKIGSNGLYIPALFRRERNTPIIASLLKQKYIWPRECECDLWKSSQQFYLRLPAATKLGKSRLATTVSTSPCLSE